MFHFPTDFVPGLFEDPCNGAFPDRSSMRVKAYSCLVLRKMMEADRASSSSGSKKRTWGMNIGKTGTEFEMECHFQQHIAYSLMKENLVLLEILMRSHPASKSTIPKENISRVGAVTRNATKRSSDWLNPQYLKS